MKQQAGTVYSPLKNGEHSLAESWSQSQFHEVEVDLFFRFSDTQASVTLRATKTKAVIIIVPCN
jgi:hypothetical protein